jgi:hypothetical protein
MTPALILALSLMASGAPPADQGEPLPSGAPTDSYELSAWCYGALKEYLDIYDKVKPDLIDIDRMFGSPVKEAEPYQSDMAAARVELKMIAQSVTAAEKASPRPIAPEGAEALRRGELIWSVAEGKTRRELARAWLSWGLPDRCDSNARELTARSLLLGKALTYNSGPDSQAPDNDASAPLPAEAAADTTAREPTPVAALEPTSPQAPAPAPAPAADLVSAAPPTAPRAEPTPQAEAAPQTLAVAPAPPPSEPPSDNHLPPTVLGVDSQAYAPANEPPPADLPPPPAAQARAPAPPVAPPTYSGPPEDQPTEPML